MWRNVRGFMSLFHSEKPVICKVHGYCVAGGTDMALCADLLVIASDAKIGYPPARVWGSPTTAMWAAQAGRDAGKAAAVDRRLAERRGGGGVGAGDRGASPPRSSIARFERLLERVARMPVNQLVMMKMLVNQTLVCAGPSAVPAAGNHLRRDRPPHRGGPCLRAARS